MSWKINMKRNDFIIVLIIVILSFVFFLINSFTLDKPLYVLIKKDNKIYYKDLISKDNEIIIKDNKDFNTVIVKDSKVYVKEANCDNQICVNHKKISATNETIICLPNKVIIEIVGKENAK